MFKFLFVILVFAILSAPALATEQRGVSVQEDFCELCVFVLGEAQQFLQANQSETQVLAFIEKNLCGKLGTLNASCVQLVATEGKTILDDLTNKVDPNAVCKKLGICPKKLETQKKLRQRKNLKEDFCELCLLIIGSVQQLVQQNQSESEILAFIDKNLCGRLGPLNGTCVGIVEVEGKAILDELTSNKTDPNQVCQKFGLCPKTKVVRTPQRRSVKTNSLCELCTLVLGTAQQLLEQNKTESEVLAFIEKNLCGRLGALNGTCTQFMETEGREVLYELSMKVDPSVVCHKFGLCGIQPKTIETLQQRRELRNKNVGKSKLPKMNPKFD